MYLKENVVISLQYSFYQQGVKTTKLVPTSDNTALGTSKYQFEGKKHAVSHFNDGVINYEGSGERYHEYQEKHGVGKLMEAQNSLRTLRQI